MNVAASDDRIQRRLGDFAAFGEQAAYIADKERTLISLSRRTAHSSETPVSGS